MTLGVLAAALCMASSGPSFGAEPLEEAHETTRNEFRATATLAFGAEPIERAPETTRNEFRATTTTPREADYYPITTFNTPEGEVLEAGALALLENGELALATRRGEIWLVANPFEAEVRENSFHRFAHGLHEVLGLAERNGWLYVTQRSDVSRLKDTDGDRVADVYELVCDEWEISGDYHEYAFGSKFDSQGNLWVVLCLTGSFTSDCKYRGWCVRITPEGRMIPTSSGIRSPGGIGMDAVGDVFYTENQGPWNGCCSLKHLLTGKFMGHPDGNRWYDLCLDVMGPRPREPESGSRVMVEAGKIPEFEPPVVMFPYDKMGQSASGIACDTTQGKFGPFAGQLFVADQSHSTLMRVYLEKVGGHYQGACLPFRQGLASGSLALEMTPSGSMFVGGTNRGWGSRGSEPFSIERLQWTGQTPFEIHEMHVLPDGFELTFTQPLDVQSAASSESYSLTTYTYIYQATYGSPEVDHSTPVIRGVEVGADRHTVRLMIDGLRPGHIHELHCDGIKSASGLGVLHPVAYYTLNRLP